MGWLVALLSVIAGVVIGMALSLLGFPGSAWSIDDVNKIAQIVALVLTPVVIALIGHLTSASSTKRQSQDRYIELAVGILQQPPQVPPGAAARAGDLRPWAIDVLAEYSPVPFSTSQKSQLKSSPLPSPPPREWPIERSDGRDPRFDDFVTVPAPTSSGEALKRLFVDDVLDRSNDFESFTWEEAPPRRGWRVRGARVTFSSTSRRVSALTNRPLVAWLLANADSHEVVGVRRAGGAWEVSYQSAGGVQSTLLPILFRMDEPWEAAYPPLRSQAANS